MEQTGPDPTNKIVEENKEVGVAEETIGPKIQSAQEEADKTLGLFSHEG